jgi:AcrR family transcriptional regulator
MYEPDISYRFKNRLSGQMQDLVKRPIRRTQAERSAATIARLICATISILHKHGYTATTTTMVAELAGVSRGAMLHHYPTKVQLMAATVYATYDSDIAAYQAVMLDVSNKDDLLDQLIDTAWACFRSANGIAQTEIWIATRSDPELAAVVLPVHQKIMRRSVLGLKSVLGEAVIDKNLKIEHILTYLVSALRGLSLQGVLGSSEQELSTGVDLIKATIKAITKAH